MVIKQSDQQIICRSNRMEISCKMKIKSSIGTTWA